jgi:proline iminopeptidase
MPAVMPRLPRRPLVIALALVAACRASSGERPADPATARAWRLEGVVLNTVSLGARRRPVRYVLHGGPGLDHTYLRPSMDRFGRDAALVYVDLRGHGRSSAPPDADGYTISSAADDLAALVAARHDPPVDVIAHDFGAAVAVAFAARHADVVRRVVLVSPLRDAAQVRAVAGRSRDALGEAGWSRVLELTTAQGTLRDARSLPLLFRRLGPMWWHAQPSDAVVDAMARRVVYRADSDANFLQDVLRWDARLVAGDVRAPVLVVAGASDLTFLPSESRELAEALPHGSFLSIDGAGHLPFVERGDAFAVAVERFFAP